VELAAYEEGKDLNIISNVKTSRVFLLELMNLFKTMIYWI